MMSINMTGVRSRLARAELHSYAVVFVLIAMALYLTIATDNFATYLNISNVLEQVSTTGIIAVGMTVLLVTANFDLSIGGIAALVGVTGVAAINETGTVPGVILALLAATALGGNQRIGRGVAPRQLTGSDPWEWTGLLRGGIRRDR